MEYVFYILAVLVTGLVTINVIRIAMRSRDAAKRQSRLDARPARRDARAHEIERMKRKTVLDREKLRVPTPWGWPGQPARRKSSAGSASEDARRSRSIRALLEDRFAPVRARDSQALEYSKVKPPLLRDPTGPHDQMDNFGAAGAERINGRLTTVKPLQDPAKLASKNPASAMKEGRRRLEGVKQPWGW